MNIQNSNITYTPQIVAAIAKSIGFKVRHRKVLEAKDAQIKATTRQINELAAGGAKAKFAEQQKVITEALAAGAPCPPAKSFEQHAIENTAQFEAMKVARSAMMKAVHSEIVATAEDFRSALAPHVDELERTEKAAAGKFGVEFQPSHTLLVAQSVLTNCPRSIKESGDQAASPTYALCGLL